MIKISIIIPIYKVSLQYLRICLNSLMAQNLQECEFIMISDGAPEEENLVCEEFAQKDSRFKFFKKEHTGVSAARNYGMKLAQGEYISFVDSDDWIESGILEEAYKVSNKKNPDIVFWNCVIARKKKHQIINFSDVNQKELSNNELTEIRKNLFFISNPIYALFIYPVAKLYRAESIKHHVFDESLKIGEDRIFNMQLFQQDLRITYLNRNGYYYRQNDNSATKKYLPNAFEIYMKYIDQMSTIACGKHDADLGNEVLFKFDECLATDYFHTDNPNKFSKKIAQIKKIFYSKRFQAHISNCTSAKLPTFLQLSLFFIQKKIFLWMYIRIFMKISNNTFKRIFGVSFF